MLLLDHLPVIAPSLSEGVLHVQTCLGLSVPFGCHHHCMGNHNNRLQLGNSVYLEIVPIDPNGVDPDRPRWFGFDNQKQVRKNWDQGRRLRGWVTRSTSIGSLISSHPEIFGEEVAL